MLGNTAQHLCRPVTIVCLQCDFLTKCLHCLLKYWPTFWKQDGLPAWPHSSTHIRVKTSEFGPLSLSDCLSPTEGFHSKTKYRLFTLVLSFIIISFFLVMFILRPLIISSRFLLFRLVLHPLLYFLFVSSVITLSITYSSSSVPFFFSYIIIISHQLDLDRPVRVSSNSLFKGPPSRLLPFCP